jgi:hypothetical protein
MSDVSEVYVEWEVKTDADGKVTNCVRTISAFKWTGNNKDIGSDKKAEHCDGEKSSYARQDT